MRIALIVDAYAPSRTSAAVQMRDLARGLAQLGHEPCVLVPDCELPVDWVLEQDAGVEILRLKAPRTKDIGRVRRALAESVLPFAMRRALARSPCAMRRWDGIVWYSPSIFFGPLVRALKRRSGCRAYLILRDLFPDWAVDAGLLRRGWAYRYFKVVERYQYAQADVIGVQSASNLPLLGLLGRNDAPRLEVLDNWLSDLAPKTDDPPPVLPFAGRTRFVYAGNMGAAQGMDALLGLARAMKDALQVGFIFVGRGSELSRLRAAVAAECLSNVAFLDEVAPEALPAILAQTHVGLLALDPRHRTHNIPGKFLTYLRAGLPVLAHVNAGNDLVGIIEQAEVGLVSTGEAYGQLQLNAGRLATDAGLRNAMAARCRVLAHERFSTRAAVVQVLRALQRA